MKLSFTENLVMITYITIPIMLIISLITLDLTWLVCSIGSCGLSMCIHGIKQDFDKE